MKINLNKKTRFFIIGIAVLCGGVLLVRHLMLSAGRVTTDDAYIEGRVHTIASKIPGTVKRVYVLDNQGIKKGDLLLELDPADYQL